MGEMSFQKKPLGEREDIAQRKGGAVLTDNRAVLRKTNKTGLPDGLKAGVENLSGMSMDHVRVHYNSAQPAQLNAHAYAQGSDIHLGPGQEKHLPHEAWHVVQQMQGRVRPTMQMKAGVGVNDDVGLEGEADVMGARAATEGATIERTMQSHAAPSLYRGRRATVTFAPPIVQRVLKIDTKDIKFKDAVLVHLKELAGRSGLVSVDGQTGIVKLLKPRKALTEDQKTAGYKLLYSLITHRHTTTIKPTVGAAGLSSEPILPPNSWLGKVMDFVKNFQTMKKKGYLTHSARAYVRGATPGVGVGTIVLYDPNLTDAERKDIVRKPDGATCEQITPASVGLAHELIHSDHFHRGTAAYDDHGFAIKSARQHTYITSRGEMTDLEEINTVGLDVLPPDHDYHKLVMDNESAKNYTYQDQYSDRDKKARTITEQQIRNQLKVFPRAGYDRRVGG